MLSALFSKEYQLTQTVETETRTRTETDTVTDPDGTTHTETRQVPYTYTICNVKLHNEDLSHLPISIMNEDQVGVYSMYMSTLGNRPDLFPSSAYPNASTVKKPTEYDIPPEAMADARFAAMMTEARKYIGYPYVWGGSSPKTSFDCSGYVSWVINHSGWNVGRLGAQGLCNICTPVSPTDAKPGDLVLRKRRANRSPTPVFPNSSTRRYPIFRDRSPSWNRMNCAKRRVDPASRWRLTPT